jgi:hypothetical protein
LRIVRHVVRAAAVANADVEVSVRPERQHAAVVVRVRRMRNREQHCFGRVGRVRRHGDRAVLGYEERAVTGARVEDEESSIAPIQRMEGQAQQALLAATHDLRADVEENCRRRAARLQHLDDAGSFDDEQPVQAVACIADEYGAREARDDRAQLDSLSLRRSG